MEGTTRTQQESRINKLFKKYDYLCKIYANKVYDVHVLAYEKEDIIQELRIKLYNSIIAYGRRWSEYKRTGRYKPVPLVYHLRLSLINRVKDFIKYVNRSKDMFVGMEALTYDKGICVSSTINPSKNQYIVNDINLLDGLNKVEKPAYILHMKGFEMRKIKAVFKGKLVDVESIINTHTQRLSSMKDELFQQQPAYMQIIEREQE
jgi:hypothetical protein